MTRVQKVAELATLQRLQALQKGQFGTKIKNSKKLRKTTLEAHIKVVCMSENRLEKTPKIGESNKQFEKRQNWKFCKGYSLCKIATLVLELNIAEKTCENTTLEASLKLFYVKNSLERTPKIRDMRQQFEKWQNWPFCKGYIGFAKGSVLCQN